MIKKSNRLIVLWRPSVVGSTPTAKVVAEITFEGLVVPIDADLHIAVLHRGMLETTRETLWSVRSNAERPLSSDSPLATALAPPPLVSSVVSPFEPRFKYRLPESLRGPTVPERPPMSGKPKVARPRRKFPGIELPYVSAEDRAQVIRAPDHFVGSDAVRLTTALVLDPDRRSDDCSVFLETGVAVELSSPPDVVVFGDGFWTSTSDWPVEDARLRAPREARARILEVFRGLDEASIPGRQILGLRILDAKTQRHDDVEFRDWRTDEEVLADATEVASILRDGQDEELATDLERLIVRIDARRTAVWADRDRFRFDRVLEVARSRERVPAALAGIVPGLTALDDLIETEKTARLREAIEEVDLERERLLSELAVIETDLAAAKASASMAREVEAEARRRQDALKLEVVERIDRFSIEFEQRITARLDAFERNPPVDVVRQPDLDRMSERTTQEIESLRSSLIAHVDDALRSVAVESSVPMQGSEGSDPIDPLPSHPPPSLPIDDEPPLRDPIAAANGLRWHARRGGLAFEAIGLASVVAAAGFTPVFAGPRANSAVVAAAEAMAGRAFSILDCDPALLAPADLLDPRRARTDVLLEAMASARRRPDRWHAVALRSMDWAPCGYWLPAFGPKGRTAYSIPPNLAVFGAVVSDGPKTPIPMSALWVVVPISTGTYQAGGQARHADAAWATTIGDEEDAQDARDFEAAVLDAMESVEPDQRASVKVAATAGRRVLGWNAAAAADALSVIPAMRTAVTLGSEVHQRVRSLLAILSTQDEA